MGLAERENRIALVFSLSTTAMLVAGQLVFYSTVLAVILWTVLYARRARPRIVAILAEALPDRRPLP